MTNSHTTVYVAATCSACCSQNQLTISSGSEDQDVSCSHCGAKLGNVASLAGAVTGDIRDLPLVEPSRETPATALDQFSRGRE